MAEKKPYSRSTLNYLKRFFRIFFLATAILSVFLLALSWAGPFMVERILIRLMEGAGLERSSVRVESITPRGIHLSGIKAQGGRLSIDFLSIHLSPSGLRSGKADHIAISGFNWHVIIGDGKADLGLPEFKSDGSSAKPPAIPFRSLLLASSSIIVDYEGVLLRVPFSLLLESPGENAITIKARGEPLGIPIAIEGLGDLTSGAATLEARIPPGRNDWGQAPQTGGRDPIISGSFNMNARWNRDPGVAGWGQLDLSAEAKNLLFSAFSFQGSLDEGSFRGRAGLDEDLVIEELEADLLIRGLSFMEYNLESMDIAVGKAGAASTFSARLDKPLQAAIKATGNHPSISRILDGEETFEGIFEWEISGKIPEELVSSYSDSRISIAGSLPLQALGDLSVHIPGWPEWLVEARIKQSITGPVQLQITEQDLRLDNVYALAEGKFRADAKGLEGSLGGGSVFGFNKIILMKDEMPVIVDKVEIGLGQTAAMASFSLTSGGPLKISVDTAIRNRFAARAENVRLRAETLGFIGEALIDGQGVRNLEARVDLGGGLIDATDIKAEIKDISLSLPFTIESALSSEGHFSVGQVSYSGISRPGPDGRAGIINNRLLVDGTWNLLSPSPVKFRADISLTGESTPAGEINVDLDWFEFPERGELAMLIPEMSALELTGQASVTANLLFRNSLLKPDLEFRFRDVSLSSMPQDLEMKGLSGSIKLERLEPLSSPGNQVITIEKIRLGAFELEKGVMAFRLEDRDSLFLEKMIWNLPQGGTLAFRAARIELGEQPRVNLEAVFEKIDFVKMLALLTEGKIDGSGIVYGRIPLSWKAGKISLDSGYIYSVPGTGHLGIRDEDWMKTLMYYVNEAMAGHHYLALVAERMEEAMRDFEYNYLTIDLRKVGAETAARIELRGKGATGDPPQEIGSLVLNINGLDELVNRALGLKMTSEKSLDRFLEDLLDFQ